MPSGILPSANYTVRVSRESWCEERGPWPLILPAASAPEFGRGGTHEENRVLNFIDYGNASINPGLSGGGGRSKGASGSCGGGSSQPRGSSASPNASTPARGTCDTSNAKRQGASDERRGRVSWPPCQSDRASGRGYPRGRDLHAGTVEFEPGKSEGSVRGRCLFLFCQPASRRGITCRWCIRWKHRRETRCWS